MNLEESLRRRISSILGEVERRGFEAVVFLNEVIGQNPSNFVYVSGPWGLGDEHNTLVFDVDGGSTLVFPHWGAKRMEESGLYAAMAALTFLMLRKARPVAVVRPVPAVDAPMEGPLPADSPVPFE